MATAAASPPVKRQRDIEVSQLRDGMAKITVHIVAPTETCVSVLRVLLDEIARMEQMVEYNAPSDETKLEPVLTG